MFDDTMMDDDAKRDSSTATSASTEDTTSDGKDGNKKTGGNKKGGGKKGGKPAASNEAKAEKPAPVEETDSRVIALAHMHECSMKNARKHLEKHAEDGKFTGKAIKRTLEALYYEVKEEKADEGVETFGQWLETKPWGRFMVFLDMGPDSNAMAVTVTNRKVRQAGDFNNLKIIAMMRCVFKGKPKK